MDLVRIFEDYCSNNDIEFRYGSKSHLNLIENVLDTDKIHLLLFPVHRYSNTGNLGLKIASKEYSGRFLLVKNSNKDLHYFNEREQDQSTSKYSVNIEPLITTHDAIGNSLLSCGYELYLDLWKSIDAIDVLSANLDGLWCNYKISTDV